MSRSRPAAVPWLVLLAGYHGDAPAQGASGFPTPTPLPGRLAFRRVSVGREYTCGIASNDQAYCWWSRGGALAPAPVGGPYRFR